MRHKQKTVAINGKLLVFTTIPNILAVNERAVVYVGDGCSRCTPGFRQLLGLHQGGLHSSPDFGCGAHADAYMSLLPG